MQVNLFLNQMMLQLIRWHDSAMMWLVCKGEIELKSGNTVLELLFFIFPRVMCATKLSSTNIDGIPAASNGPIIVRIDGHHFQIWR